MKNILQTGLMILGILIISSFSQAQEKVNEIKINSEVHTKGNPVTSYDADFPESRLDEARRRGDVESIKVYQNQVNAKHGLKQSKSEVKVSEANPPKKGEHSIIETPQTNVSLLDTNSAAFYSTVTEQTGDRIGRIWTLTYRNENNNDIFRLFFSDDNGVNWDLYGTYQWWFTSYRLTGTHGIDGEFIYNSFNGKKMLYFVFECFDNYPNTQMGAMKIFISDPAPVIYSQYLFD